MYNTLVFRFIESNEQTVKFKNSLKLMCLLGKNSVSKTVQTTQQFLKVYFVILKNKLCKLSINKSLINYINLLTLNLFIHS